MTSETTTLRPATEDRREDLKDTLESMEQQVKQTVQTTVAAAGDTLQTVKQAVEGTVETVKESMQETVASVKRNFDLRFQVEQHPWAMLAGAVAVGFAAERLLSWASAPRAAAPVAATAPPPPPPAGPGKPGLLSRIAETFGDELAKLKELAVTAVAGQVHETVVGAAPDPLADEIGDVVDSVTTKMGGRPAPQAVGTH
jgi:ElaB/YqjD/DUF883 family membrane-anchored ribosome-binding protein